MTDADLARQEWLDERAAVLEFEAKFPRDEAERLALVMWAAKVQRENASAEHGDAPGARGGERMSSGSMTTRCAPTITSSPIASQNSRLTR